MRVINLSNKPANAAQVDAGVVDFNTRRVLNRIAGLLRDDTPSASRKRLIRLADELAEVAATEGRLLTGEPVTGALVDCSQNLTPFLFRALKQRSIQPLYWFSGQLHIPASEVA